MAVERNDVSSPTSDSRQEPIQNPPFFAGFWTCPLTDIVEVSLTCDGEKPFHGLFFTAVKGRRAGEPQRAKGRLYDALLAVSALPVGAVRDVLLSGCYGCFSLVAIVDAPDVNWTDGAARPNFSKVTGAGHTVCIFYIPRGEAEEAIL